MWSGLRRAAQYARVRMPRAPTDAGGRRGFGSWFGSTGGSGLEPTGLYNFPELRDPQGFDRMTTDAIRKGEQLVQQIVTEPPGLETVWALDNISDTVCLVVDTALLCRSTHPDPEYIAAAEKSYLRLNNFFAQLNADRSMYDALAKATEVIKSKQNEPGHVVNAEEREALEVAASLLHEFERGGIKLNDHDRKRITELSTKVIQAELEFGENLNQPKHLGTFVVDRMSHVRDLPHQVRARMRKVPGNPNAVQVTTDQVTLNSILLYGESESFRRSAFIAGNSTPKRNLEVLDNLLMGRYELARHLGAESHADFTVKPQVAGSPLAVWSLLERLSAGLKDQAEMEVRELQTVKRGHLGSAPGADLPAIRGWDQSYYTGVAKAQITGNSMTKVSSYLPLDRCLEGLNLLVQRLYGAKLVEVPMAPGESWAPDIKKIEVVHEYEGPLGYIYLDLYPRPRKYSHSAQYIIRNGRRKPDGTTQGCVQLPYVAVVCSFVGKGSNQVPLLQHSELETLFHEFGHVMHSLLAKTHFQVVPGVLHTGQHLAGTRGPMDYVEVPSHLMEYFAYDYRVLGLFAKHHITGETIPEQLVQTIRKSRSMFSAIDMQTQVLYAMLDQKCHNGAPPAPGGGTTELLAELHAGHSVIPYEPGTAWQARFGHLVNYGASYYAYIFARSVAATLWQDMFMENPLERSAGQRLRSDMLQYGGVDPTGALQRLMGEHGLEPVPGGGHLPSPEPTIQEVGRYFRESRPDAH